MHGLGIEQGRDWGWAGVQRRDEMDGLRQRWPPFDPRFFPERMKIKISDWAGEGGNCV